MPLGVLQHNDVTVRSDTKLTEVQRGRRLPDTPPREPQQNPDQVSTPRFPA